MTAISLGVLVGPTYITGLNNNLRLNNVAELSGGFYTLGFTDKHPDSTLSIVSGSFTIVDNELVIPQSYSYSSIVIRESITGYSRDYTFFIGPLKTLELDFMSGVADVTFSRDSTATYVDSDGILKDTQPSKNFLLWTNEFNVSPWVTTNTVVTPESALAPDGTMTAATITAGANAGAGQQMNQSSTLIAGGLYVYSVRVKRGSGDTDSNRFMVRNTTTSVTYALVTVNYGTGVVTQTTGSGAKMEALNDGWWLLTIPFVSDAILGNAVNFTVGCTGNAETPGEFIYAWGAQVEAVTNLLLGDEMLVNGSFNLSDYWTLGTGITISNGTLNLSTSAIIDATQPANIIAGRLYQVKINLSSYTSGAPRIGLGGATLNISTLLGEQTYYMVALSASTTFRVTNSSAGAVFSVSNVSLREVTIVNNDATEYERNAGGRFPPRFEYDPNTLALRGLLIEDTRTNRTLWSEDFTNSVWTDTIGGTSTRENLDSSLGFTRCRVTATSAGGGIRQIHSSGLVTNTVYSFSFYIESAAASVSLVFENGASTFGSAHSVILNPSTGGFSSVVGFTRVSSVPYKSGYLYSVITAASTTATPVANVEFRLANTGDPLILGRPQFEAGLNSTSYIRTTSAVARRNADTASITGARFTSIYNQSEGTFVARFSYGDSTSALIPNGRFVVYANDGTTSNRNAIYNRSGVPQSGLTTVTSATQASPAVSGAALGPNTVARVAYAYKVNDFGFALNGVAATPDTLGTVPTVNRIGIGSTGLIATTINALSGYLESIDYYPARLPDSQLQALTTG